MTQQNAFMPDAVYAVGGGGIELVTTAFEQQWLQRELLRPRRENPESVDVHLIDSAMAEAEAIAERVDRIEALSGELADELRDPSVGEVGTLRVDHHVLTENVQLTRALDLTGPDAVDRIATSNGFAPGDWWLDDDHVDENLDLAQGVFRRRALAKAIYHKNRATDRSFRDVIDMPRPGKVAICVGLGGGTGAGIAIDLAMEITDRQPTADVTLFGVLPTTEESDRVHANAYAALSELEHLSHAENREVFRDIVLYPIEATEYKGKSRDTVSSRDALAEFDEAFAYSLVSYYNTGEENAFDRAPAHGPFTVAVPQVLRPNVEAIEQTKSALRRALDATETVYGAQREIHEAVRTALAETTGLGADGRGGLTQDDREDLADRLSEVEALIRRPLFEELDYESVARFTSQLADARAEADGIEDVVDSLAFMTGGLVGDGVEYVDETDDQLARVIDRAVEFLDVRRRTLAELSAVEGTEVRRALRAAVDVRDGEPREIRLQRRNLDTAAEDLREQIDSLETERAETERELAAERERRSADVERIHEAWREETADLRAAAAAAAETDLSALVTDLERAIDRYVRAVGAADTPEFVREADREPVSDLLAETERVLDRLAAGDPDALAADVGLRVDDIRDSLDCLERARLASLDTDREVGRLAAALPWTTDTEAEIADAEQRLADEKASLSRYDVLTVHGNDAGTFAVDVAFDARTTADALGAHVDSVVESAVEELVERLPGCECPPADRREALQAELRRDGAVGGAAAELVEASLPDPADLAARLDETESRLRETEEQLAAVETAESVLSRLEDRGTFGTYAAAAEERETALAACRDQHVTAGESHTYIKRLQPEQPLRAARDDGIGESTLLREDVERQRLRAGLEELGETALGPRYHGIERPVPTDGTRRYDGTNVHVGLLSRGVEEMDSDLLDLERQFSTAFGLGDTGGYDAWQCAVGNPWDVAVTVFVDGVFLDNLSAVTAYREGYERRSRAAHVHLHHAYGLAEGVVVRRDRLVDVNDAGELSVYLGGDPADDRDVVGTIADEYLAVDPLDDVTPPPAAEGD